VIVYAPLGVSVSVGLPGEPGAGASDVLTARLRNYEYNPVWGFIPDQAQLR
jgi:hypothetical protein